MIRVLEDAVGETNVIEQNAEARLLAFKTEREVQIRLRAYGDGRSRIFDEVREREHRLRCLVLDVGDCCHALSVHLSEKPVNPLSAPPGPSPGNKVL